MATNAKNKRTGGSGRSRVMAVAAGAISIIMVLTMMLPSLSLIFSGRNAEASTSTDTTPTTVEEADEKYQASVDALTEQLEADPNSLAALANLGFTYFDWASAVRSVIAYSATDEQQEHQDDLYLRAQGYFDRYLALNDAPSVHVSRILTQYYLGEEDEATEEMATYAEQEDFGPAWANLGMFYANAGETDAAKAAFNAAIEADPRDEYGSKSYAEQYLAYLEQIEALYSSLGDGAVATTDEDGNTIITLDGSDGATYSTDEDGNVVVSPTDTSLGTTTTTVQEPEDLKNTVGGLF